MSKIQLPALLPVLVIGSALAILLVVFLIIIPMGRNEATPRAAAATEGAVERNVTPVRPVNEAPPEAPSGGEGGSVALRTPAVLGFGSLHALVVHEKSDRPAVDVGITLVEYLEDGTTRRHVLRTDSVGSATFEGLQPGPIRLALDRGIKQATDEVIAPDEVTKVRFQVPNVPQASIRVLLSGTPISGAEVWLGPGMTRAAQSYCATTQASGWASIDGVGNHDEVIAFHNWHRPSQWHSFEDGMRTGIELNLQEGPGGHIQVFARQKAGGRALPGASVVLWPQEQEAFWPPTLRMVTDPNGMVSSPSLEPGRYSVSIRCVGYVSEMRDLQVEIGGTVVVDCVLSEGATVNGRVLDKGGNGVAGASVRVSVENGEYSAAITKRDGRFVARGVIPGEVLIQAYHKHYGEGEIEYTVGPSTKEAEVVLGRGPSIHGRLVDEAGSGLAGWLVGVSLSEREGLWACYAETNDRGAFLIEGCPLPGGALEFKRPGNLQGQVVHRVEGAVVGDDGYEVEIPAEAMRPISLEGSVVGSDGRPVSGSFVKYRRRVGNDGGRMVSVDGEGDFVINGLLWGPYELVLGYRGMDLRTLEINIEPGERLNIGPVVLPSPVGRARVVLTLPSGVEHEEIKCLLYSEGRIIELPIWDGVVETPALPVGQYSMTVSGDRIQSTEFVVMVEEADTEMSVRINGDE